MVGTVLENVSHRYESKWWFSYVHTATFRSKNFTLWEVGGKIVNEIKSIYPKQMKNEIGQNEKKRRITFIQFWKWMSSWNFCIEYERNNERMGEKDIKYNRSERRKKKCKNGNSKPKINIYYRFELKTIDTIRCDTNPIEIDLNACVPNNQQMLNFISLFDPKTRDELELNNRKGRIWTKKKTKLFNDWYTIE